MPEKPDLKPGDWITLESGTDAVVCKVYENNSPFGNIEAVYLDDRGRDINIDLALGGEGWKPTYSEPSGGYADKYDWLRRYVTQLRSG